MTETVTDLNIRLATIDDAQVCAEVYRPYVEHTSFTFETIAPTTEMVTERMQGALEHYAWVVAERDGQVVGYAYAHEFSDRPAYDWTCETSVYVSVDERRGGVGRAMYDAMMDRLAERGYRRVIANVVSENEASIRMHKRMGFREVGRFERVGWKFDEWHDVTWLELDLDDDHPAEAGMARPAMLPKHL